jgi:DNA primase
MRFSPSFLDEIRARLPVSEVVAKRVKLRKQGREWAGLSPFNAEKTPSFFVNDQKGFYHDFSSGRHGDIFRFLMDTEGVGFPEAVERLAGMAGLSMPAVSREAVEEEKKRASLHEVLALAARFFEDNLQSSLGAKARGYLADRRLDAQIQRAFGLGYATGERFALRDALAAKGVSVDQMIAGGLLVHGEDVTVPYDRFRDRVMFPIHDRRGRVIGFGGRAMEAGAQAKYLNSPETELFHKGSVLFNHHRARQSAHEKGEVIAVEGYVDVIQMSVAGFAETVAPLGTALTQEQCELLWRMASEPILCFDGDKAGRKAAFRAIDIALPLIGPGKSLRFALLPEGQDPDDLVRSSGAGAVEDVLKSAKPLAEMLFLRETEGQTFDTPERRAGLERRLRELVASITDEPLRRYYRDDMEARLAALFGGGRERRSFVQRGLRPRDGRVRRRFAVDPGPQFGFAEEPLPDARRLIGKPKEASRDIAILAIVINHPDLLARHAEEIAEIELSSKGLTILRDRLLDFAAEPTAEALANALIAAGFGAERDRVLALAIAAETPDRLRLRSDTPETEAELVLRQSLALHRKARALNKELKLAEKALADDFNEQNFARLRDIRENLANLAGAEAAVDGFGGSDTQSPTI